MRLRAGKLGFTLVELMIVLALISIFTGLIVAEMRGSFEDALLRSNARKLIDVLGWSASQSVALNQRHIVSINPNSSRFEVRGFASSATAGEGDELQPIVVEAGSLDPRITVEVRDSAFENVEESPKEPDGERAISNDITFYPDGTADGREIALRDRLGAELFLRINPVTGRVLIVDPQKEGPR